MHLFIFFLVKKMYYMHKATSAVSCVKPNASQWEAMLRDDIGFLTVYRRIYHRKFFTLSNQTMRYICKCIRIRVDYCRPKWLLRYHYYCQKHYCNTITTASFYWNIICLKKRPALVMMTSSGEIPLESYTAALKLVQSTCWHQIIKSVVNFTVLVFQSLIHSYLWLFHGDIFFL